jgi:hypothetical protein
MFASWLAVMLRLLPGRRPIKKPGGIRQAKDTQIAFVGFGNLAIFLHGVQGKTHSFASPSFDGFAFIVFL